VTKKIDRYIFTRLLTITVFVLLVLIFIFIVIDFSENSDDFTDKGATFYEIFGQYYLNYIPEIIRLVSPVAVFVACLYLTSQMADRLEIIALKAAGVSLYRLILPYLAFAFISAGILSYLDGFIIPDANAKRIAFEKKYLQKKSKKMDGNQIFRQESENSVLRIGYYNSSENIAYQVDIVKFDRDSIREMMTAQRMAWLEDAQKWRLLNINQKQFLPTGFKQTYIDTIDTALNILPRDLTRRTSDIFQLTYPEALDYIKSLDRSGATGVDLPRIQFYGRLVYPFSILVVTVVGFSLASVRRPGGKGFHIAAGLTISFLYLALMKVFEPFGEYGELDPVAAAVIPHLFFLLVGLGLLFSAKK